MYAPTSKPQKKTAKIHTTDVISLNLTNYVIIYLPINHCSSISILLFTIIFQESINSMKIFFFTYLLFIRLFQYNSIMPKQFSQSLRKFHLQTEFFYFFSFYTIILLLCFHANLPICNSRQTSGNNKYIIYVFFFFILMQNYLTQV